MTIHTVLLGETVTSIAQAYGVTPNSIIYINQLAFPYILAVGQALLLGTPSDESRERREILSGGFAYPFISRWVMEQTLPYLSELSIFSYGFTPTGQLLPPALDDSWMIQAAKGENVVPVLTLTPLGADGQFNDYLINQVVNDHEVMQTLIQNLIGVMKQKGYQGLDIDFEFIAKEDRDAFSTFVNMVTKAMNEEGFRVSVDLAPKTSPEQGGVLLGGKDYGAIGAAANQVMLMTYEWGYTFGPPQAVAPLNQVRKVVEYAITQIPAKKINLGIPNYGYDWTLPYRRGGAGARTIGNVEATQIAVDHRVEILFDEKAQSPHFFYTDEGGNEHVVWFEDVRSLNAKYDLIEEFNLMGCGIWQLMQLNRAEWMLLADRFWIL